MQPAEPGTGRSARLALVAVALLVLLAVVAFSTRSGFGHQGQAKPTPTYVSYAFTAFLILFVLAIPVSMWAFFMQAREGQVVRKSFQSRVLSNTATMLFFGVLAFGVIYLKRHHGSIFDVHLRGVPSAKGHIPKHGHRTKAGPYEPSFQWSVLWVAIVLLAGTGGFAFYKWRARKRRTLVPLDIQPTVAEDFAASIEGAIDDLESEPDARRAVIAAYARMEAVLARHGLRRKPSETPFEYLRRVLLGLTARGESVERLTALFEQAKFSRHEIGPEMKQEAIAALRDVRDDLQAA